MRTLGATLTDIDFTIVEEAESVRQRVRQHLKFWLSTWFLNRTAGIPYLPEVVGSLSTPDLAARVITDAILDVADVTAVSDVVVSFDRDRRIFSYSAFVSTIYGDMDIGDTPEEF